MLRCLAGDGWEPPVGKRKAGGDDEAAGDDAEGDTRVGGAFELAVERLGDGHLHRGVDGAVNGLDDEGDRGAADDGGDSLGDVAVNVAERQGGGRGVHHAADEGTGPEHGGEHLPGEGVKGDDRAALGLLGLVCGFREIEG